MYLHCTLCTWASSELIFKESQMKHIRLFFNFNIEVFQANICLYLVLLFALIC